MKKFMLVFLMAASVRAGDGSSATGQVYRSWSQSIRQTYVVAYLDGYSHSRLFTIEQIGRIVSHNLQETIRQRVYAELKENWGAICFPSKEHTITVEQMTAILDRYMADHPERWDKPIGDLAEEAFSDACEKREKKP